MAFGGWSSLRRLHETRVTLPFSGVPTTPSRPARLALVHTHPLHGLHHHRTAAVMEPIRVDGMRRAAGAGNELLLVTR